MDRLTPPQRQWLDALRSNTYVQGTGYLNRRNQFCCLGVACDLFVKPDPLVEGIDAVYYEGRSSIPPPTVVNALNLRSPSGKIVDDPRFGTLTDMNDSEDFTFTQIADFIESNSEKVFTNASD